MNEEEAVLDFFAQEENLPLALSVADLVDNIRLRKNNDFWSKLAERLTTVAPAWQISLTEDRNVEDCLVGLSLQPATEQALYLRPMLEQQFMGGAPRIYFGLMWNSTPTPDKLHLPEVTTLRDTLLQDGFKTSDNFLAWQWSPYYPRSKKFLMRLSTSADALMEEATGLLQQLLVKHGTALNAANTALRETPRGVVISLDTLRIALKPKGHSSQ